MEAGLGGGVASVGKPPKTRICYVCGRGYGLSSFDIHLKQCKALWEAREAKKPPHERKPLPAEPVAVTTSSSSSSPTSRRSSEADLEAQNQAAFNAYNSSALARCEFCGRTFLPEKLAIHNRSCTADHPAKSVADSLKRSVSPYTLPPPRGRERERGDAQAQNTLPDPQLRPQTAPDRGRASLVPCPNCGKRMPLALMDSHMGNCQKQQLRTDSLNEMDGSNGSQGADLANNNCGAKNGDHKTSGLRSRKNNGPEQSADKSALDHQQQKPTLRTDMVDQLERRVEFLENTSRSIVLELKDIKRVLAELKSQC